MTLGWWMQPLRHLELGQYIPRTHNPNLSPFFGYLSVIFLDLTRQAVSWQGTDWISMPVLQGINQVREGWKLNPSGQMIDIHHILILILILTVSAFLNCWLLPEYRLLFGESVCQVSWTCSPAQADFPFQAAEAKLFSNIIYSLLPGS